MYDVRYAEEQTAKYEAALKSLKIQRDNSVLDVGCGTGLLFNHIATKTKTIIAVDASRKILLYAKSRAQSFPNIHLLQADADYLPLKDNIFDNIFAVTVVQNMPNPEKTLNEIKRVAKPDAVLVISALKRKFSLENFETLLLKLNLSVVEMKNENLKCYIAVCTIKTP